MDKEQGKTKHEVPRSVNYRATQSKNNIGTIALERSVVNTTEGVKGLSLYNVNFGNILLFGTIVMLSLGHWHISVTSSLLRRC